MCDFEIVLSEVRKIRYDFLANVFLTRENLLSKVVYEFIVYEFTKLNKYELEQSIRWERWERSVDYPK